VAVAKRFYRFGMMGVLIALTAGVQCNDESHRLGTTFAEVTFIQQILTHTTSEYATLRDH